MLPVDDAISALADPIRREILRMVRDAPRSAGAIAEAFSVSRPAVSRHLRVLREAGLGLDEASGRERLYRLERAPLAEVEAYLAALHVSTDDERAAWERRFMALETEVSRVRARGKTARTKPVDSRKKETG
jgi:DNA-binding transcriptional ArsR family regulator